MVGADKDFIRHVLDMIPNDATEIGVRGHKDVTITYSSDDVDWSRKIKAQWTPPGTYDGPKRRWRLHFLERKQLQEHVSDKSQETGPTTDDDGNTPINIDDLPMADE